MRDRPFARDHNCTKENKYEIKLSIAGIFFISGIHADDKFVLSKKVGTICSGLRLCALV